MRYRYDFIIVGAGSAGCALANRLSSNPTVTVLLIESGPSDKSLFVQMPRGIGILVNPGSKFIWDYQVEPRAGEPAERWYRGRTLGGSSSINGMVHMRGAPLDYDVLHTAMTRDKKVRAGGLRFVVLKQLGEAATQSDVPAPLVEASFRDVGAI